MWASFPAGTLLASIAHRLSAVEELVGVMGNDELYDPNESDIKD